VKTEDLIVHLASSASPVRRLASPHVRLARWLGSALAVAALAVVAIGPRADLMAAATRPAFAFSLLALVAATVGGAAVAFQLSVPGAERSAWQRGMAIAAMLVWPCVWLAVMAAEGPGAGRRFHVACAIEIATLGVLGGWSLTMMVRRAAPLRPGWTATLASVGAVALASAATQVICPIDAPGHQLVGHVLVAAIVAAVAAFGGRRLLRA
jgi:hypothetical protein